MKTVQEQTLCFTQLVRRIYIEWSVTEKISSEFGGGEGGEGLESALLMLQVRGGWPDCLS